jgi:hypothetical protein
VGLEVEQDEFAGRLAVPAGFARLLPDLRNEIAFTGADRSG